MNVNSVPPRSGSPMLFGQVATNAESGPPSPNPTPNPSFGYGVPSDSIFHFAPCMELHENTISPVHRQPFSNVQFTLESSKDFHVDARVGSEAPVREQADNDVLGTMVSQLGQYYEDTLIKTRSNHPT